MARFEESGNGDPHQGTSRPSSPDGGKADLHMHTTYSDGVYSPEELVRKVHTAGISTISITDHDHLGAFAKASSVAREFGIDIIPGLELSISLGTKDLHILAYFIDPEDRRLLDYLTFFRGERLKRAERIVKKLNQINVPLKLNAVLDRAGIAAVGRPHIASALVDEGYVDSFQEAFQRFIGTGGPAYETKFQLSPAEAFRLISGVGGLSFLAHPGNFLTEAELVELIKEGMDGIEVVHPSHSPLQQDYYRGIVNNYFLLESGGSDFHGGKRSDEHVLGTLTVPQHVVKAMRRRLFPES